MNKSHGLATHGSVHVGTLGCALTCLLAGCATQVIKPDAASDRPPVVTVTGVPVAGGSVVPDAASADQQITVSPGTQVMVLVSARNPGGVRHLSVQLTNPGTEGLGVLTVSTPDVTGKVPDALYVLGSDGSGHAGSAVPIQFTMTGQLVVVTATASNWNSQSRTVIVKFVCGNCQ